MRSAKPSARGDGTVFTRNILSIGKEMDRPGAWALSRRARRALTQQALGSSVPSGALYRDQLPGYSQGGSRVPRGLSRGCGHCRNLGRGRPIGRPVRWWESGRRGSGKRDRRTRGKGEGAIPGRSRHPGAEGRGTESGPRGAETQPLRGRGRPRSRRLAPRHRPGGVGGSAGGAGASSLLRLQRPPPAEPTRSPPRERARFAGSGWLRGGGPGMRGGCPHQLRVAEEETEAQVVAPGGPG